MDYIKLAQRTISMLDSMIKSGECHTSRTEEMVSNAMAGLEQLSQSNDVGQGEQLVCECMPDPKCRVENNKVICTGCNKERK